MKSHELHPEADPSAVGWPNVLTTGMGEPNSALAISPPVDERTLVLKHGESFALFDSFGDISPRGMGEAGVYHFGTRHLSRFDLRLAGRRFLLLGSTVHEDSALLSVDLTNLDMEEEGRLVLHKDTIHVHRKSFLHEGVLSTELRVRNYGLTTAEFQVNLRFQADFADLFEIRGVKRERRGRHLPTAIDASDRVDLRYEGLDGRARHTRLTFDPAPDTLEPKGAAFFLRLDPDEERVFEITASFGEDHPPPGTYRERYRDASRELRASRRADATVRTSNEYFNGWIARSASDLHLLISETRHGPYPYAGIPWFSTPFGRDGIITALMLLWVNPEPARGVLRFLAEMQADETDPRRDAEPGKILHETRRGEMSALGEVPFRQYYGTVDATPLFVVLADAYYRRTGDYGTLRDLWPHVKRALEWIDRYGDRDGDGFVEYERQADPGIVNQGWKDSNDSVFHQDGTLAEAPIALCEVQGYVYQARLAAARMARVLGEEEVARTLVTRADQLRERFEEAFWSDELGFYALALDRDKRPCLVRSSNAGHCLFSGIASPDRGRRVGSALLSRRFFSGWGVRTIPAGEARYNPMSYHNGSVWPHDNAMIGLGLARYGMKDQALKLLDSQFDLSMNVDLRRLPELVCGFHRRAGAGPTEYPVACAPQAWAAGTVFMLLEAALGLELDATRREISFSDPRIPTGMGRLTIEGLRVGDAEVDLALHAHRRDVSVNVLRRRGEVRVTIRK